MVRKKIALAADHAGFALKTLVRDELAGQGYETLDLGTGSEESVDYPDFGRALGEGGGPTGAARPARDGTNRRGA